MNGKEAKIALLNTPFSFFDHSLIAKPCQTVENPWSAREGRISLELPIVPGGVYSGCGAIESGGKSHFPEQKSFHCSFCVRKSERFQRKPTGGRACSPVCRLVKTFLADSHGDAMQSCRHGLAVPRDSVKSQKRQLLQSGSDFSLCVLKRRAADLTAASPRHAKNASAPENQARRRSGQFVFRTEPCRAL